MSGSVSAVAMKRSCFVAIRLVVAMAFVKYIFGHATAIAVSLRQHFPYVLDIINLLGA
ncbi:9845_t:CDS:2, partial [Cetraspora pellucida]